MSSSTPGRRCSAGRTTSTRSSATSSRAPPRRLLIAVQELDSRPIAEAVLAAKARKVTVQIILEGDYLVEEHAAGRPVGPSGDNEDNRVIHAALLRAGVDLITDLNPKIFHQKFIVRDPGVPTAAVLTGSTNFTCTDTGTNPPDNRDSRQQPQPRGRSCTGRRAAEPVPGRVPAAARRHVRRRCTSGTSRGRREFRLGRIRVKPIFAPEQGPEMEIMKQMLKAARTRRLRDVHLRPVVRHRRHDGLAARGRHPDPRRPRPRPGRRRSGRPPSRSRRPAPSCTRTRPATASARSTTS